MASYATSHDAPWLTGIDLQGLQDAQARAEIGKRGDLLGIYVGNQMRTVKQHKELHKGCRPQVVSGVGYAAELCGMMLDARVDPTGLALVNELGQVNVWMMKVDLETEDGATVSFYADFLATTLREHDELRGHSVVVSSTTGVLG